MLQVFFYFYIMIPEKNRFFLQELSFHDATRKKDSFSVLLYYNIDYMFLQALSHNFLKFFGVRNKLLLFLYKKISPY